MPTKYQQLKADLEALATQHEFDEQDDSATPEVVTALQRVVAEERALANKEYVG